MTSPTAPVVLVIFGGTGDLFRRKLAPSLMTLHESGELPKHLRIIGTGRSSHTDTEYRTFVASAIREILHVDAAPDFLSHFEYVDGELHENALYSKIENSILQFEADSNAIARVVWYCSIAPHFYGDIAHGISEYTRFLQRPSHQNALLIEKPIGHNIETCNALNTSIARYFNESQVTRIEHYLTKETLLQLPDFLTKHQDIYELFSGLTVESIDVDFYETIGVEKRGAFYDSVGAFRDVGQNHELEMLAHTCIDYTHALPSESRIAQRIDFLSKLSETSSDTLSATRYQYKGYTSIPGVSPHSFVETAYTVSGVLPQERWAGITFRLTGGKRLGEKRKRIVLHMKKGTMHKSKELQSICISIDPECVILEYSDASTELHAFRPGHAPKYQYVEEYSRILAAGFAGSQMYSVSAEEVQLLWKIADRYTTMLESSNVPPIPYDPDTNPFIHK
jgi:glucose-6-phosphate 1-dehydrogenase